jgi:hypothetical protein
VRHEGHTAVADGEDGGTRSLSDGTLSHVQDLNDGQDEAILPAASALDLQVRRRSFGCSSGEKLSRGAERGARAGGVGAHLHPQPPFNLLPQPGAQEAGLNFQVLGEI